MLHFLEIVSSTLIYSVQNAILIRFMFLTIGSGILAHWKNLTFTKSSDDKLVSIIGGGC